MKVAFLLKSRSTAEAQTEHIPTPRRDRPLSRWKLARAVAVRREYIFEEQSITNQTMRMFSLKKLQ